jgi:hypothetical protein
MPVSLFTLYYLYAAFSSRCCHSSELPVALAARATHQSRQPHTPPKKQGHIISQQCLQSLCSPWLKIVQKVRSALHYRRTMPVSLFTLYFLHVAVTAANSQSPWPPEPLISHDSHTPPEETEPHHITAVSPVTLVTLVEKSFKRYVRPYTAAERCQFLSLRCIFFTLMSQQRTPSRPGRQSHSSVTIATYPPEETGPHHITAVSPVTLLTLVENRSKGTFGLTLPPNDASFSLYAVFSSRCCHSSELPVALAARATHQSRQPHAPRRNRATSYHSSVSSHSGHPG